MLIWQNMTSQFKAKKRERGVLGSGEHILIREGFGAKQHKG